MNVWMFFSSLFITLILKVQVIFVFAHSLDQLSVEDIEFHDYG